MIDLHENEVAQKFFFSRWNGKNICCNLKWNLVKMSKIFLLKSDSSFFSAAPVLKNSHSVRTE